MANRTKKALAAALKKFLNQTTMDKITVTDITSACDINRQAFYYHFQDIYALGEWMFSEDIRKVLDGEMGYVHWQDNLLKILLYVEENKVMMQNIYHSLDREQLEKWLFRVFYQMFMYMIEEQSNSENLSQADKEFVVNFNKYALTGLILNWVQNGMKEDPRKMVPQICRLCDVNLPKILQNFQK